MSAQSQTVNHSENIFKCADRVSPGDDPKDITAIKELYLPLDVSYKATHVRANPFGAVIYRNNVAAGNVFQSYDGKRLVLEVGCNTVIYILINPRLAGPHHRLFIQSDAGFSADTTIRRDAAEIVKNTRHVETVVKYEMYFIMGAMSTLSLSAWLAVTGSDVTVLYSKKRVVSDAAKVLAQSVLKDLAEMKSYAPMLHAKIWELIALEANVIGKKSVVEAPSNALKSEKVQAQVAGVIFGKWSMPNSGTFNAWSLIATLFGQAAIKSSLAYPETFMKVVDHRYTDWQTN